MLIHKIPDTPGKVGACEVWRFIDPEERTYYAGKRAHPRHTFMRVNELVSARLAALLDLNVPRTFVREHGGEAWLLSEWVWGRKCHELLLTIKGDREVLVDWTNVVLLACFDKLVMNPDRHLDNVILTRLEDRYELWAIDHDQALFNQCQDHSKLFDHDQKACSDHDLSHRDFHELAQAVRPSRADWVRGVNSIKSLSDEAIHGAVYSPQVEQAGLSTTFQASTFRILKHRRDNIGPCMKSVLQAGRLPFAK